MDSPVEEIKERLPVDEVVGSYITLSKAGSYLKARCPFHKEKTPSFFVSPERGTYHCFGCGAKGDVFSFVQEHQGLDFREALELLADRAGVELRQAGREERKAHEQLYAVLEEATQFFEKQLKTSTSAQSYLKERGVGSPVSEKWRLGYAPSGWEEMLEYMKKSGYTEEVLISAGLIRKSEKRKGSHYDFFRDRIMFPIFDSMGRVIAFSGRIVGTANEAPKYINSPESPLFNKSRALYGLSFAKQSMRRHDFSIVVEGQLDVLLAHQSGFANTVATSGTALTRFHLEAITRGTKNVLFVFDGDQAGMASAIRGATLGLSIGVNVKIARLPEGADPADVLTRNLELWKRSIREALHVVDLLLEELQVRAKDDRAYKLLVHKEVVPLLALIENQIDRAHFVARVAERLSVPEEAIFAELNKIPADETSKFERTSRDTQAQYHPQRSSALAESMYGIILWLSEEGKKKESETLKKSLRAVREVPTEHPDEALLYAKEKFEWERIFEIAEDLLQELKIETLKEKRQVLLRRLRTSEKEGDIKTTEALSKEYQQLSHELQSIQLIE